MASLVTVAQGVYIVKPDYDTSRAKNYADIYTKRRNDQLQLALNAAQRDLGTEAAIYSAQMEAYQRHLNSLIEAKADLEKQLSSGFVDLEKTLLAKKTQVEVANAQLQEKRAEAKGKKMTVSRSMGESETYGRGGGISTRGQYGPRNIPTKNQNFIDDVVKRGTDIGEQIRIAEGGFESGGMESTGTSAPATRAGIVRGLVEQETTRTSADPAIAELDVIERLSKVPGGDAYINAYRNMLEEERAGTGGGSGGGRSTRTAYTTPVSAYGGLGGPAPAAPTPEFSPELAAYRQGLEKRISSIQNEIYGLQQPTPPSRQDLLGRTQQLQEQYYGRGRERPVIDAVSSGIQSLRARGGGKGGTMAATAPTPPAPIGVTSAPIPAAPQEQKPVEVKLVGTGTTESIVPGSTDDFMAKAVARAATLAGPEYDKIITTEGPGKTGYSLLVANSTTKSKNGNPLQATIQELQKQYGEDQDALLTAIVAAMAANTRQKQNAPRVQSQTVTK